MRNRKRTLGLALAFVMLLGVMAIGTSAASYPDVSSSDNEEAIEVLRAVGVMIGDEKGNFNPDQNLTRNEMAVVMTNLLALNINDYKGVAPFTDVPAWAEPYVSACYANKIVFGTSATTYSGSAAVTTAEASLMVMKALGYFQYQSDFGNDWQRATIEQGSKIGLYAGVNSSAAAPLTRNDVAQLGLNALQTSLVEVHAPGQYKETGVTLAAKLYDGKLVKNVVVDALGRPAGYTWTLNGKPIYTVQEPDASVANYVYVASLQTCKIDQPGITGTTESAAKALVVNLDGTQEILDLALTTKSGKICYDMPVSDGTVARGTALDNLAEAVDIGNWFVCVGNSDGAYTLSEVDSTYAQVTSGVKLSASIPTRIGEKYTNSATVITGLKADHANGTIAASSITGLPAAGLDLGTNKVLYTYAEDSNVITNIYVYGQPVSATETSYAYAVAKGATVAKGVQWTFAVNGEQVTCVISGAAPKAGKIYTLKAVTSGNQSGSYEASEVTSGISSVTVDLVDGNLFMVGGTVYQFVDSCGVYNVSSGASVKGAADTLQAGDTVTVIEVANQLVAAAYITAEAK